MNRPGFLEAPASEMSPRTPSAGSAALLARESQKTGDDVASDDCKASVVQVNMPGNVVVVVTLGTRRSDARIGSHINQTIGKLGPVGS